MAKKIPEPQALQLCTLSGTFEAARAVIRTVPMSTISTYDQLAKHLIRVSKNKDALKELFTALDRLDKESHTLGATTLVKPADHPLFIRTTYAQKDRS